MVRMEDVNAVTEEVLVHRLQLTFQAESEGITASEVVRRLVREVSGSN
jgi:MoxR-like ATPase